MIRFVLFILLFLASHQLFGQDYSDSIRQLVLKQNNIDSLYVFGEWNDQDGNETHLKYLGTIKGPKQTYKIMTSCWIWGHSKRATSRILVFNSKNQYLGNYNLTLRSQLPTRITNNQIEFLIYISPDGLKKSISRLGFERGIPNQFFLANKDGSGNFYHFDKPSKKK